MMTDHLNVQQPFNTSLFPLPAFQKASRFIAHFSTPEFVVFIK